MLQPKNDIQTTKAAYKAAFVVLAMPYRIDYIQMEPDYAY
tara:strand:- start:911 stop:1030 length:120 start_codon:yes stop_codon:yes gene_type:complete